MAEGDTPMVVSIVEHRLCVQYTLFIRSSALPGRGPVVCEASLCGGKKTTYTCTPHGSARVDCQDDTQPGFSISGYVVVGMNWNAS